MTNEKFCTMKKRVILMLRCTDIRTGCEILSPDSKYYNKYNYESYLRPVEDADISKIYSVNKFIYGLIRTEFDCVAY